MSLNKVALTFSNNLGNFIQATAALKILRGRGHKTIDMLTDTFCVKNNISVKFLAEKLFDNVIVDTVSNDYDAIYASRWSCPRHIRDMGLQDNGVHWKDGTHEVSTYLDAIGASQADFCGFLMPTEKHPRIKTDKIKIGLTNASTTYGSRRGKKVGWHGFVELSRILDELGYAPILLGYDGELDGCTGIDFTGFRRFNVSQVAHIIKQCDVLVTTDSGLMHVADAIGTPIILLAGPTPVTKSMPLVSDFKVVRKFTACAPCFGTGFWKLCDKPTCMSNINIYDVLKTIFSMVSMSSKKRFVTAKPKISQIVIKDTMIADTFKEHILKHHGLVRYKIEKEEEIIYIPSYDMIGDMLGVTFIWQWLKSQFPLLKLSWLKAIKHKRDGAGWYEDFNVFDWIPMDIYKFYNEAESNVSNIDSRHHFSVWSDIGYLGKTYGYYPKMDKKPLGRMFKSLPKKYVAFHVLRLAKTGERSTSYVGRRALDLNKYEELSKKLTSKGIECVRLGASYDAGRIIEGITDLSMQDISLEDTFRIIANSSVFIGGDCGLKLAACTMGIPTIVEIDEGSKKAGGLGGCDPKNLTVLNHGVNVNELYINTMRLLHA